MAKRRAFGVEELKQAEWALLECGEDALAYEKYEAAKKVAEGRGFVFMPMSEILALPIEESIARIDRRKHYNTKRPHSALGHSPPAPEAIVPVDQRPTMH